MKRLLILFAVFGVVGTAAAFRGGALPGPAGGTGGIRSKMWSGFVQETQASNTIFGQFVTGSSASTVTNVYFEKFVGTANGVGTGTLDLTDTSGTSVCSVNLDCTTLTSAGTGTATCSAALSPSTVYQLRNKTTCAANSYVNVHFKVDTP